MTDEQLKAAAIALCEIRGLYPFDRLDARYITRCADFVETIKIAGFEEEYVERWATLVPEIKEHEEIREAVIRAIAGNGWSK